MKTRCFRGLVKICGEHGILPNSYIIPGSEIQKLGESPIASGGFSDVWPGIHGEDDSVAIKVIRYYASDDIKKIKKVRYFAFSPHHGGAKPFPELLPRGHNLETRIPPPERIEVDRGLDEW